MTVAEAARRLGVDNNALRRWLDEYEKEHGPIIGRKREPHTTYSLEQQQEIVQNAVQLFKEEDNMTVAEAARRLNINDKTLWRWLNEYEKEHGPIPGRKRRSPVKYSPE